MFAKDIKMHVARKDTSVLRKFLALITFLSGTFVSQYAQTRENGYALECVSVVSTQTKIVSFLETDTNKISNSVSFESTRMWDTHMWSEESLLVQSYSQRTDDEKPILSSSILINRKSLSAELSVPNSGNAITRMRCQRWSPRTRNK